VICGVEGSGAGSAGAGVGAVAAMVGDETIAGWGMGAGEWDTIFIRHRAISTAPATYHLQRRKIFRSFSSSPIIFFHISSGMSDG
jgi:hypothetical protein